MCYDPLVSPISHVGIVLGFLMSLVSSFSNVLLFQTRSCVLKLEHVLFLICVNIEFLFLSNIKLSIYFQIIQTNYKEHT